LEELLNNPAELDRLSKAGREGVEKHFHIDIQARNMVTAYEDAISKTKNLILNHTDVTGS
jgi:hypothetical protein